MLRSCLQWLVGLIHCCSTCQQRYYQRATPRLRGQQCHQTCSRGPHVKVHPATEGFTARVLQVAVLLHASGGLQIDVEAAPAVLPACRRLLQRLLGARHVHMRPTGRFLRNANLLAFEGGCSPADRLGLLPYHGPVHPEHLRYMPDAVHSVVLLAPLGEPHWCHGCCNCHHAPIRHKPAVVYVS